MTEVKRISLDKALRNLTGGDSAADATLQGRCLKPPIGCGKRLESDYRFQDRESSDEYRITGLCQECQNSIGEVESFNEAAQRSIDEHDR